MFAALLDACVLVPNALCDILLRLAEGGFYRPLWSTRILEETSAAILQVHPELDERRVARRLAAMSATFEDAVVSGWEQVSAGLDLPDPDDRHVLGAAIAGAAQAIVTFNLKDFPGASLAGTGIEVVHPDEFLLDQLDLFPGLAIEVLTDQAEALTNPQSDVAGVLNRLERCGAPKFADAARLLLP